MIFSKTKTNFSVKTFYLVIFKNSIHIIDLFGILFPGVESRFELFLSIVHRQVMDLLHETKKSTG